MPFEIYTGPERQPNQPYLLVDKFGRIALNTTLRELLGIPKGSPFHALLGYDPTNGNIGLAVPGEIKEQGRLVVFDRNRYYATVASFIRKYNIKTGRYYRIPQTWNGWHQFRHESYF